MLIQAKPNWYMMWYKVLEEYIAEMFPDYFVETFFHLINCKIILENTTKMCDFECSLEYFDIHYAQMKNFSWIIL